jgi:hypothetical protein
MCTASRAAGNIIIVKYNTHYNIHVYNTRRTAERHRARRTQDVIGDPKINSKSECNIYAPYGPYFLSLSSILRLLNAYKNTEEKKRSGSKSCCVRRNNNKYNIPYAKTHDPSRLRLQTDTITRVLCPYWAGKRIGCTWNQEIINKITQRTAQWYNTVVKDFSCGVLLSGTFHGKFYATRCRPAGRPDLHGVLYRQFKCFQEPRSFFTLIRFTWRY